MTLQVGAIMVAVVSLSLYCWYLEKRLLRLEKLVFQTQLSAESDDG